MRPPGSKPPGWRLPPGAREEVDRVHNAQRALFAGYVYEEDNTPLKISKHMAKWRHGWVDKRTGKWREVWREPNGHTGGRFAKKPLPGERAKSLGLRHYALQTSSLRTK